MAELSGAARASTRPPARAARTYATRAADAERRWRVVNADGATLGRLSTVVAGLLRGKHKTTFSPHLDVGDPVVVVNAARVRVTGRKLSQKTYVRHSGYPGGLKSETLERLLSRRPEEVVRRAVRGMLPQNRLGARMLRKLHVYAGPEHPHAPQRPEPMPVEGRTP
jgi:large subunit ribosomal protein L13